MGRTVWETNAYLAGTTSWQSTVVVTSECATPSFRPDTKLRSLYLEDAQPP